MVRHTDERNLHCGALRPRYLVYFGRLGWAPPSICTDNMWPIGLPLAPGTANSGMETQHYQQGAPNLFLSPETHGGKDG